MLGFNRKVGEFSRYKEEDAERVGILTAGIVRGTGIVNRLVQINLWNKPPWIKKLYWFRCLKKHIFMTSEPEFNPCIRV